MADEWVKVVVVGKDSEGYKEMTKVIEQNFKTEVMDAWGHWIERLHIRTPSCGRVYRYKDPYYELKQAKEEGETIQLYITPEDGYVDLDNPNWSYPVYHYRIKPEIPFPKLMGYKSKRRNAGMMVFMEADRTGPVVYAPKNCDYTIGFRSTVWLMENFEDFEPLEVKENDNSKN